ncbi:cell surface protein [Apiospora phragmitis]|uniref:Cell surface protein n=1 Tax=Apiospora phragmitis TaxID=2905665 RepID=A0ABR1VGQ2_9PEZI
MYCKTFIFALAASPLVAAHGKVAVVQGDAGGNGTGLGIMGGVVPGPGRNAVTEVDTTVFGRTNIQTDGLGKTNKGGKNTVDGMKQAMAQSGDTLPQVSSNGGKLTGTFHIVTTDGAGPLQAVIDPTGTGAFSQGQVIQASTQVPGKGGNIRPPKVRSVSQLFTRSMDVIMRRASNVNEDYPMAFDIPAGTTCQGTMGNLQNVCLVKIANANRAGPFGGVVAMQIVDGANGTTTATPVPATDAGTSNAAAAKGEKGENGAKAAKAFQA